MLHDLHGPDFSYLGSKQVNGGPGGGTNRLTPAENLEHLAAGKAHAAACVHHDAGAV